MKSGMIDAYLTSCETLEEIEEAIKHQERQRKDGTQIAIAWGHNMARPKHAGKYIYSRARDQNPRTKSKGVLYGALLYCEKVLTREEVKDWMRPKEPGWDESINQYDYFFLVKICRADIPMSEIIAYPNPPGEPIGDLKFFQRHYGKLIPIKIPERYIEECLREFERLNCGEERK